MEIRNFAEGELRWYQASGLGVFGSISGLATGLIGYVQAGLSYTRPYNYTTISNRGLPTQHKYQGYNPVEVTFTVLHGLTGQYPTASVIQGVSVPQVHLELSVSQPEDVLDSHYIQFYNCVMTSRTLAEAENGNTTQFTFRALRVSETESAYSDVVLNTRINNLLAYWPLTEKSGTVARDLSQYARNGAYVGPSFALGQTGIGDGRTSVSVTADAVNLYTAALATAFNGAAGTVMFWAKVSDAGVWTDGQVRYLLEIYSDNDNNMSIYRQANDYVLSCAYKAGGTAESISPDLLISSTDWMHMAVTWDAVADKVIFYLDSRPIQVPATGLGTWNGSGLNSALTCLGALRSDSYANPFTGNIAHAAIWNVALSGTEIEAIHDALRPTYGMICLGDSKSDADAWIGELCTSLGAAVGRRVEQRPLFYAVGGYTIAQLATLVSANVGTEYTTPRYATINIGANDMNPLPSATTWKGNLTTIINTLRDKWPSILIYVAKPWRQGEDADSTTMAGWIDTVIATYASGVYAGPNESVWLKGSDDGATNTTDGIHYSVAGNTACAAQWLAVMT